MFDMILRRTSRDSILHIQYSHFNIQSTICLAKFTIWIISNDWIFRKQLLSYGSLVTMNALSVFDLIMYIFNILFYLFIFLNKLCLCSIYINGYSVPTESERYYVLFIHICIVSLYFICTFTHNYMVRGDKTWDRYPSSNFIFHFFVCWLW